MADKFGPGQAGRDFIRVLRCHVKYGAQLTAAAIAEAQALGAPTGDLVVSIVDRKRQVRTMPENIDLSKHPELLQYNVAIPELSIYQVFLERGTSHEQCIA